MKIKSQFYFFLAGTIIIPILIVSIISFIVMSSRLDHLVVPGYEEIVGQPGQDYLFNEQNWQKIQERLGRKPNVVEYTIFDANYQVIISNIDEFESKKDYSKENILEQIKKNGNKYIYQIEYVQEVDEASDDDNSGLWMLTRVNRAFFRKPNKLYSPFFIISIILGFLFAFCLIMIILIMRSITKSVTELEEYTRKIAAGNLNEYSESTDSGSNEIVSLRKSIDKMKDELQDSERRRMRFIMGLSHDLRTPIALIKGYAEALDDGMIDDEKAKHNSLKIIVGKSEVLNERIDELIDFVKLNTNEWRQNLKTHNLSDFLNDFCKRFTLDAELMHRNFSFKIDLPPETEAAFDEKLFTRVLENIVGNACRYTSDGGKILLHAYFEKSVIKISISDDGIGISKDDLPYIFDPLWRGTNSRQEEGKGLGLSIVRSIVNSHGWQITAESPCNDSSTAENSGSVFTISM